MLKKLVKHEFKETARLLIPLNLIVVAMTAIGAIMLSAKIFQEHYIGIFGPLSIMLYILSIFCLFILTAVFLTMRYYKTVYGRQGYLTHTLPVSTTSILNTKILVAAFWLYAALIITILCILLLVRVAVGSAWDSAQILSTLTQMAQSTDMSISEIVLTLFCTVTVTLLCLVFTVCACLAIGQLFQQHRIAAAVGAYVVIYIIQQIMSLIGLFVLGIRYVGVITETSAGVPAANNSAFLFRSTMWMQSILALIFIVIFYFICHQITRKKLNLE